MNRSDFLKILAGIPIVRYGHLSQGDNIVRRPGKRDVTIYLHGSKIAHSKTVNKAVRPIQTNDGYGEQLMYLRCDDVIFVDGVNAYDFISYHARPTIEVRVKERYYGQKRDWGFDGYIMNSFTNFGKQEGHSLTIKPYIDE